MNRIRAGFCLVPNPFNPKQISQVSLDSKDVDAFVFWSKNPEPMFACLNELDDMGFLYYFLFTLNDYPKELEPNLPTVDNRLKTFHALAKQLGAQGTVWRYDPIIITPKTDYSFHAATFEKLSNVLCGATNRVIISIVDLYKKTIRRMAKLHAEEYTIDPNAKESPKMVELFSHISCIAKNAGMQVLTCAEEKDFSSIGICAGSCIDSNLINAIGGRTTYKRDLGQRPDCKCSVSRDIGINDTCLHGCTYCYATKNNNLANQKHSQHNPNSPVLVGVR